ncbi:hypothetical protein C1H46_016523 [Malus baccata]|uniref:Uncharacterized protein n=1 Tax=Malus baccata TaxID=106549 RepID=A0A540MGE1_MALBA|nr:hypothetical protein C1H46_016523 [Malus baccata]
MKPVLTLLTADRVAQVIGTTQSNISVISNANLTRRLTSSQSKQDGELHYCRHCRRSTHPREDMSLNSNSQQATSRVTSIKPNKGFTLPTTPCNVS